MAAALVTVVPSRSEAFGLVNIESMAMGTPVIASEVGGLALRISPAPFDTTHILAVFI